TPSVNQRLPSGPEVIPTGLAPRDRYCSLRTPLVVIRPRLSPNSSVNHSAPSIPAVMSSGDPPDGSGDSLKLPLVLIRATLWAVFSVNQNAPSGPSVRFCTELELLGSANREIAPDVVIRPIAPPAPNHNAPPGPETIPSVSRRFDGSL